MDSNRTLHFLASPWRTSLLRAVEKPVLAHVVNIWLPLPEEITGDEELTPEVHCDIIALVLLAASLQLPVLARPFPHVVESVPRIASQWCSARRITADTRIMAQSQVLQTAYQRRDDGEKLQARHQAALAENEKRRADGRPLLPLPALTSWRPDLGEALAILTEILSDYEHQVRRCTQTIQRTTLLTPLRAAQVLTHFLGETIWVRAERMMPEFGNRYPIWVQGKVVRATTRGIFLQPHYVCKAACLAQQTAEGLSPGALQKPANWFGQPASDPPDAVPAPHPAVCEFLHGVDLFPALTPQAQGESSAGPQALP